MWACSGPTFVGLLPGSEPLVSVLEEEALAPTPALGAMCHELRTTRVGNTSPPSPTVVTGCNSGSSLSCDRLSVSFHNQPSPNPSPETRDVIGKTNPGPSLDVKTPLSTVSKKHRRGQYLGSGHRSSTSLVQGCIRFFLKT